MDISDIKRLKAPDEDAKLKKRLTDQMREASTLHKLLAKNGRGPAAKREVVAYLQSSMGLVERWICSFVGADRKIICSCRPARDGAARPSARARQRTSALSSYQLAAPIHPA